jgi:hypothetical protein
MTKPNVSASINFDGNILNGKCKRVVLECVRKFLEKNKGVLIEMWDNFDNPNVISQLREKIEAI